MKILVNILILLFLSMPLNAQGIIEIRDFKGIFTNADLEDIPKEFVTELQNLRPINGKLVKTFAFGKKIDSSIVDVRNFTTFIETSLPALDSVGFAYYVVLIDDSTNEVIIQYLKDGVWTTESNNDEVKYHKYSKNPIVFADNVMRILPGNVGEIDGNEAKGAWVGIIGRDIFDQTGVLIRRIYNYTTSIDNIDEVNALPSLSNFSYTFTPTELDSGTFDEPKYYKFSLIYDGIQESLLNEGFVIDYDSSGFGKIDIEFVTDNLPTFRTTAINVYRSDDPDGVFNIIHTVDFLRDSAQTFKGDSARNGAFYIYIPNNKYSINNAGQDISIYLWNSWGKGVLFDYHQYHVHNPGTGIHTMFRVKDTINSNPKTISPVPLAKNFWDYAYTVVEQTGGTPTSQGGVNGAYAGPNVIFVDTNLSNHSLAKGVFEYNTNYADSIVDSLQYRAMDKNFKRAIGFLGDSLSDSTLIGDTLRSWRATSPSRGNYFFTEGSPDKYEFFDTGLIEGEEHPLLGEVSIKVNGKFAKIIGNRLWQGNIVLDPGDKNEVHNDWVSYSELSQYDVNPVSNIISFADLGGGGITGITELFGNPVVLMRNSISIINIKSDFNNPAEWNIIESVHNIGNIADNGYISLLGRVYVVYYNGIYQLSANNLAETAQTPTELLKITEPIEDIYLNLSLLQKQDIMSEYDQSKSEIIFSLGDEIFAYNIAKDVWREIDSDKTIKLMTFDENANVLVYDSINSKIYSFNSQDSVSIELFLKDFHLEDDRKENINYIYTTYSSRRNITLNLFTDIPIRSTPASQSYLLPATTSSDNIKDLKRVEITKIEDAANIFSISYTSGDSLGHITIYKIRIYHDGELQ